MFRLARWRLVFWNVLVLSVILLLLETVVYTVFYRQVYTGVDSELRARAEQAISAIADRGPLAEMGLAVEDESFRTIIVTPDNSEYSGECLRLQQTSPIITCPPSSLIPASLDAIRQVRATGQTDTRTVQFQGHQERVTTFVAYFAHTPYTVQISRTAAGEADALHNLRLLLFLGGILGIVLSALGSLFLANKALVPIRAAFNRQREFTADASHELRTPLALIRANAEMLAMHGDRLPPGDGELVAEIIQETNHLNRLVGDLLTLARADADSIKIEQKPVDFRSLVSEVHEDVQRIAESRGIESDISMNGPVTVSGDEVRLRQLLLILLDNALKYTDPGGRVDVSLGREDHRARLVVSDTGIGIPAEDQKRVFDRFYRVDRAREHESGGTGLGLSIAQWIVQAHNGSIKVESELGKGTRFLVDLPAS